MATSMAQYQRKLKKGIRWWYKFNYDSVTYNSACVYLSKNEARKAENAKYDEVSKQVSNPALRADLSLLQIINERLDSIQIKKSLKYYNENKRYLAILLKHLGNVSINTVQKTEIEKLLLSSSKSLKEKNKDNYTINAMIRCYKALFNYAIDNYEDCKIQNPIKKIDFFSIEKRLKYIPSATELNLVLKECDEDQKRLLLFLDESAARINECLNLKGADVFESDIILYTRKSKNSDRVPRKLPKPRCLKGLSFKPEEYVFPKWREQPKFLERKIKKLKLNPWGFHNLRHRRASIWSKEGKPIFEIMCLLGHSNISTTQRYLQLL